MEFRCVDPTATVRAANVRATLDAFSLMPALGERLVAKHRLAVNDLRPDRVVLVQDWLDVLAEIQSSVGPELVRTVGMRIVENADFPPQFGSVEAVLLALDDIYRVNHSGDVGRYVARTLADGGIEVGCETPYPRTFERGLVEGIASNKRLTKGRKYVTYYADGDGKDRTCTVTVHPRR